MNALRQAAEALLDLTAKIDEQLAELVFKLQDLMARMSPDDRQAVEARYQSILRDRQERYAEKAKMRSLKEVKGTVSDPQPVQHLPPPCDNCELQLKA